ncbi:MAG: hypothetical protein GX072_04855 [Lysinibacillus sp.]|nr:hypothetical protein [Lysinibacillus sp.]
MNLLLAHSCEQGHNSTFGAENSIYPLLVAKLFSPCRYRFRGGKADLLASQLFGTIKSENIIKITHPEEDLNNAISIDERNVN